MRWACSKFALFAVIALAAGVFATAPPAHAQATVDTEVLLLWRDKPDEQPTGETHFFARVTWASGSAPTTSVSVKLDDRAAETRTLKAVPPGDDLAADACEDEPRCVISNDITLDVGLSPHYFKTELAGDDTFKSSVDELGLARGSLVDSSETSQDGDLVTYTFQLLIWPGTPQNRRPTSPITFSDDQGHSTGSNPRQMNSDLKAEWTVSQSTGLVRTVASYPGGGDDIFLPFDAPQNHSVDPKPQAPDNTSRPATTVRTTTTVRRSILRTPTTAALAPINAATTTSIAGQTSTTPESFGDFTTIAPSTTGQLSAASNNNDEGPPIAVVATTLLALAVLGGVAALRRYRKGGIDWF